VNRIEASVSTLNIPSKNLLLKCGMQIEGVLRQHRYHRGKYVDVFFFSMLKEDF
jgi:ribosomal-protein-alanine N-acetyltransferase